MTPELASHYEKLYKFVAVIKPGLKVPSSEQLEGEDGDMSDIYLTLADVGRRIGEKRNPLSTKQLRQLFRLVEFELAGRDTEFANAVATSLLESIHDATENGGFDFGSIDQFVGRRARDYLHSWAEFQSLRIQGLSKL